jgi:hypothetical protein
VFVGSFDEFAVDEAGAGADERDEFGCVDGALGRVVVEDQELLELSVILATALPNLAP